MTTIPITNSFDYSHRTDVTTATGKRLTIYTPKVGQWFPVYYWYRGASFRAGEVYGSLENAIRFFVNKESVPQ